MPWTYRRPSRSCVATGEGRHRRTETQVYRLLDAVLARAVTLAQRFQEPMDTLFGGGRAR
jgi:hypothetical protein